METPIKICVQCKYYKARVEYHDCVRGSIPKTDLVTGEQTIKAIASCEKERSSTGACGEDGVFWEEKIV